MSGELCENGNDTAGDRVHRSGLVATDGRRLRLGSAAAHVQGDAMTDTIELVGGTAQVGDGPALTILDRARIEPEYQYIRSDTAVLADPTWGRADSNGHSHRWTPTDRRDMAGRPRYDILTAHRSSKRIPCDGGECGGVCEGDGYTVPVWLCNDCSDEIQPGYRPDELARGAGIGYLVSAGGWDLTVDITPTFKRDGHSLIHVPSMPGWTSVLVTPSAETKPLRGRGIVDWSEAELVAGERPSAVVHFYPETEEAR